MRVKLTQVLILAVVVSIVIILTLYIKGIGTGSSIGIYEPNMGLGGFRITVPIFGNGSNIPSSYACNGVNFTASFPVIISNIPTGTKVLMVVMIDIDANMFIHWALIDTPPVNYIPPNLPFLSRWRFLALHGLPAIYLSTVSLGPLTAAAPALSPGVPSHYGSRKPRVTIKGVGVSL